MEKIIYPGMKPALPTTPVKLEGVPEVEINDEAISKVRDAYQNQLFFLTEKRTILLLEFGLNRDSVIESPAKNVKLQEIQKDIHFADAVIRRTLDLFRAADFLVELQQGTKTIDPQCVTLIANIPLARKAVVELMSKDLNVISALETMIITLINDYRMLDAVVTP